MAVGYGVQLALRTVLAPLYLAARWASPAEVGDGEDIPVAGSSLAMLGKIALDEVFFTTEVISAGLTPARDRRRLRSEVFSTLEFFGRNGWLDDPAAYHQAPPPLRSVEQRSVVNNGLRYTHVQFDSGFEPHPGEPGRDRWLGYTPNRTAHAWLLQHPGPPRPWLICTHGYRMGNPLVDFVGFRALWLHHKLGLNVLLPVLPLHGPRAIGSRSGDGFLTGDFIDTLHLQAHAMWDLRRMVDWIYSQDAPAVGVYGLSLGGYTAALLSTLESGLDCVIAGIPATCFVRLARRHIPSWALPLTEFFGLDWEEVERIMRVVSPLAMPSRVPWDRRFLFAGVADRLVPPEHVRDLWLHWDRPRMLWFEGGHVSFNWDRQVRQLLHEALELSGLIGSAAAGEPLARVASVG